MGKIKTTKKSLRQDFVHLISVPNEKLSYILWAYTPVAYVAGKYGWDADVYSIDYKTCIVTGYRNFGNYHPSIELCKEYNDKGKELFQEYQRSNSDEKEAVLKKVDKLLNEFAVEATYK